MTREDLFRIIEEHNGELIFEDGYAMTDWSGARFCLYNPDQGFGEGHICGFTDALQFYQLHSKENKDMLIQTQHFGGRGSGGASKAGGGKGAGSGESLSVPERVQPNSELQANPGMRITKVAQEAFEENYRNVRNGMRNFGVEENISTPIDFGERGYVSLQTLKGIQAKITSEQRDLDMDIKLGILSTEKARTYRAALNALQRGLNYTYTQHKDYWNIGRK